MSTPVETPPTFDVSQLPSVKIDGMSIEEEATKRKKTCRFIEEACRILKLPRVAISTALVFFHRFYAKHSFGKHDRFEVAVACILLAAKTEESPRKVVNVLEECHKLRSRAMAAGRMSSQGNSPTTGAELLDPKGEEFNKLKERILLLERVVLHTIGFELSVDHPYKFIVDQVSHSYMTALVTNHEMIEKLTTCLRKIKIMIQRRQIEYRESKAGLTSQQMRDKLMNEVVQYAMNFANDSFQTSLCIQYSAELIAKSCVFLGGQFAKTEADWLTVLEVADIESFASICVQLLELVAEKKGGDQAAFRAMRAELERLRNANAKTKAFSSGGSDAASPKRQRLE